MGFATQPVTELKLIASSPVSRPNCVKRFRALDADMPANRLWFFLHSARVDCLLDEGADEVADDEVALLDQRGAVGGDADFDVA